MGTCAYRRAKLDANEENLLVTRHALSSNSSSMENLLVTRHALSSNSSSMANTCTRIRVPHALSSISVDDCPAPAEDWLSNLRHFPNKQTLDSDGNPSIIKEGILYKLCHSVKSGYANSYLWSQERKHGLIRYNIEHRLPSLHHYSRVRQPEFYMMFSKENSLLSHVGLPTDYPRGLLLHYFTCQDPECDAGPAFKIDGKLLSEITKWEEEVRVTCTCLCSHEASMVTFSDQTDQNLLYDIQSNSNQFRAHPESIEVREHVHQIMAKVEKYLKEETGWRGMKLQLVGSAEEGTRAYFPDEYDYVLLLDIKGIGTCMHKNKSDELCKICINEKIYKTILMAIKRFENKFRSSIWQLEGIQCSTNKFIVIHMQWYGKRFKNLEISVDLVPVIKIDNRKTTWPKHRFIGSYNIQHRITLPSGVYVKPRSDLSELENRFIHALPPKIKNGYTLAKAMRTCIVFENIEKAFKMILVDDISNIVTSYMLKTCLLHLTQDLDPQDKRTDYSDVYWCTCIYGELLKFIFKGKMPNFMDQNEDLFHSHRRYQTIPMLLVIGRILQVLGSDEENILIVRREFLRKVEEVIEMHGYDLTAIASKNVLNHIKEAMLIPLEVEENKTSHYVEEEGMEAEEEEELQGGRKIASARRRLNCRQKPSSCPW